MRFFFAWTGVECPLAVDSCGASLALAWSPKNGEVFRIGRGYNFDSDKHRISDIRVILYCTVTLWLNQDPTYAT